MIGVRIFVDLDERVGRQPPLKQVVDLGLHPAILHRHVQHEWPVQILHLANVVLDIGAVIGNRAIDLAATAQQVAKFAAEAVADRTDLAVALLQAGKIVPGVLHVAHGEVVVEVVVEVEGLIYVLGVFVREFDPRLLPPEQIGHQADESGLGEFMCMMAHGVVDTPDLHDRNDRTGRRLVGNSDIGAHLSVTYFQRGIERLH